MIAAVGNSPSILAPSPSKPASQAQSSSAKAFQQSLATYLQNTTSGAGGPVGANPSQTLSSDMMSSLLKMQA
jgi:hypothetical protein